MADRRAASGDVHGLLHRLGDDARHRGHDSDGVAHGAFDAIVGEDVLLVRHEAGGVTHADRALVAGDQLDQAIVAPARVVLD